MVRTRRGVYIGNREIQRRYVGNKLIFEDLGDKTEPLSGTEIYTDKADDSVVHVEMDGKSYQHAGSGKNLFIGEAVTHRRQSDNVHWEDFVLTYKRSNLDTYSGAVFKLNVKPGVTYNLSFECVAGKGDIRILNETESLIIRNSFSTGDFSIRFASVGTLVHIVFTDSSVVNDNKIIKNIQIEEGSTATEYEPPALTPDYPIEIHSLNDFDVVSQKSEGGKANGIKIGGRNLVLNTQGEHELQTVSGSIYRLPLTKSDAFLGEELTFSFKAKSSNGTNRIYISIGTGTSTRNNITGSITIPKEYKEFKYTFTASTHVDTTRLMIVLGERWHPDNEGSVTVTDIKLEKGKIATDWTPAPEDILEDNNHPLIDKINLSLNEPLRSLGDVKDRLFRDTDGAWKVERNIGEITFNGSESWWVRVNNNPIYSSYLFKSSDVKVSSEIINNRYVINYSNPYSYRQRERISISNYPDPSASIIVTDLSKTSAEWTAWLSENPLVVLYELAGSTIETLSQELQNKLNNLRSFQDSNYIYTVSNNDISPTLHTTFKSKGWYDYYQKTLLK